MIPLNAPLKNFEKRRKELVHSLQPHSDIIVLFGGSLKSRNYDNVYRFRIDSNFHYLTGFAEPESALLLWKEQKGKQTEIHFEFFCLPRDRVREQWDGFRYGPARAKKLVGATEAFEISKFQERMGQWISSRRPGTLTNVYSNLVDHPAMERDFRVFLEKFPFHGRRGVLAPQAFFDVRHQIYGLRLVKDAAELDIMRKSSRINVKSHLEVLKHLQPGQWEYQAQGLVESHFSMNGASDVAYGSICASGSNATILHYHDNSRRMKDGDLFLIDAGCEYKFYASDITRTYPVNGSYTKEQRQIMDIVAEAHQESMQKARVGVSYTEIHKASSEALVHGLCSIKLLKGKPKAELASGEFRRYFPHGTGHWLGIDVHDPCPYTDKKGVSLKLQPGQVFTIEPGLYFMDDDKTVPAEYRGIGVRIEDDVLITRSKPEVLTEGLPRFASEIESYMKRSFRV